MIRGIGGSVDALRGLSSSIDRLQGISGLSDTLRHATDGVSRLDRAIGSLRKTAWWADSSLLSRDAQESHQRPRNVVDQLQRQEAAVLDSIENSLDAETQRVEPEKTRSGSPDSESSEHAVFGGRALENADQPSGVDHWLTLVGLALPSDRREDTLAEFELIIRAARDLPKLHRALLVTGKLLGLLRISAQVWLHTLAGTLRKLVRSV
ncbi:MAG: hypothetical protein AAGG07_14265 [Planctomycetota bacterium]